MVAASIEQVAAKHPLYLEKKLDSKRKREIVNGGDNEYSNGRCANLRPLSYRLF